jgi:hypothetical protein
LPGVYAITGFQLRYILTLKPGVRERLTVPVLPYSEISRQGAGMYLGEARQAVEASSDATCNQHEEGGAAPTQRLQ